MLANLLGGLFALGQRIGNFGNRSWGEDSSCPMWPPLSVLVLVDNRCLHPFHEIVGLCALLADLARVLWSMPLVVLTADSHLHVIQSMIILSICLLADLVCVRCAIRRGIGR